MRILFLLGGVVIGVPLFKLLKTLESAIKKNSSTIDESIRGPLSDVLTKTSTRLDELQNSVSQADKVLEESKVLLQQLQHVAQRWEKIIDTVEMVPVRNKIKKTCGFWKTLRKHKA